LVEKGCELQGYTNCSRYKNYEKQIFDKGFSCLVNRFHLIALM